MSQSSKIPLADPLWLNRRASAYYTDSHRRLQREVRHYIDTEVIPFCHEWEQQGFIPDEVYRRHAELGYVAATPFPLPTSNIGSQRLPGGVLPTEWDGFHDLVLIDEIARCGYLAGSDVAGLTTTAGRKGDVYIVNGAKKWITNSIFANYCTAAVRTGGDGVGGISALVMPLKQRGVTCRKIEDSGVHASGSTYIGFDDVEVPVANLLGEENKGFPIIMSNFNHERLWLACTSLRLARVCIEDAYRHAITRETFGKKLIGNQVIRAKLSEMGRLVDSAYGWMEQLVYMAESSNKHGTDLTMGGLFANLKVLAGRTLERVNREAQQVLGGLGYSKNGRGARIEQIGRDLRVMVVGGGSEEILSELAVNQEIKWSKL